MGPGVILGGGGGGMFPPHFPSCIENNRIHWHSEKPHSILDMNLVWYFLVRMWH